MAVAAWVLICAAFLAALQLKGRSEATPLSLFDG
jgi:hypothetical protein